VFSSPLLGKSAFLSAAFANLAVNESAKAVINPAPTKKMQLVPVHIFSGVFF